MTKIILINLFKEHSMRGSTIIIELLFLFNVCFYYLNQPSVNIL